MMQADVQKLVEKLAEEVSRVPRRARVAVAGYTPLALDLSRQLAAPGSVADWLGIYEDAESPRQQLPFQPLAQLASEQPDIVVVAEDGGKERYLERLAELLPPTVRVVIGGFGHFAFRDAEFDRIKRDLYIPSFANGYPNSLTHIYQCLAEAGRAGLRGVVAEFGMFKGGTTMLISRFIEALGQDWKVYGFDTFGGFPPRRSVLDLYEHPDCVYLDVDMVRRAFEGRNVEIVVGDVVQTVRQLADQDLVVSFVDTDNYTSASAIIDVIADRTLVGGAIVFDHWAGRDRFLYTVGERIAAKTLAGDSRYFNLHDTGVFLRQR